MDAAPEPVPPAKPAEDDRPDSRVRLGMETTLLAWVRTGLGLMGFGFVLARFAMFLHQMEQLGRVGGGQAHASLWFGIILIVLGVVVNLAATAMHYPFLVGTRRGETDLPQTWWLALALAVLSALAGVGMAALLFVAERQG